VRADIYDAFRGLHDWLLQVYLRYHVLPETLWIAVNIVDRFLTKRVVSLVKLRTTFERIYCPSLDSRKRSLTKPSRE
jgi:hypothetical protein